MDELQLSDHFHANEFRCRCCGKLPEGGMSPDLIELLEEIRGVAGRPVKVTSGYRCLAHNRRVKSKDTSQHRLGTAADIVIEGLTPKKVGEIAGRFLQHCGGIGIYSGFTHVDVRRQKARW
jgi:uncharacterized protein YcbK (DUF882 family)